MKLSKPVLGSLALSLGLFAGCTTDEANTSVGDLSQPAHRAKAEVDDDELALSEVPDSIRQAALAAVPGLVLESAEIEEEDGVEIYSLEGVASGTKYCVEVSLDGKVLDIQDDGPAEADASDDDDDDAVDG